MRSALIWSGVTALMLGPVVAAGFSPLLEWRQPVYILAGFAGILGLALMLLQPLLAGGYLPGLPAIRGRRVHRWTGAAIVALVVLHVLGLWVTSPPDVVDALLFVSPAPFSVWGVLAMWLIFASAVLALLRRRLGLRPMTWRRAHGAMAVLIVLGSALHAVLIEGTMEPISKALMCLAVVAVTAKLMLDLRLWARRA